MAAGFLSPLSWGVDYESVKWQPSISAQPRISRSEEKAQRDAAYHRLVPHVPIFVGLLEKYFSSSLACFPSYSGVQPTELEVGRLVDSITQLPGVDAGSAGTLVQRQGKLCRKRQQVANMVWHVQQVLQLMTPPTSATAAAAAPPTAAAEHHVVDFAGGTGHVGLPIAANVGGGARVTVLDCNPVSLRIARERAGTASLHNLGTKHCFIAQAGTMHFDVGVGLHACGEATDGILDACLQAGAAFVLAPCCVGKVAHAQHTAYPRSRACSSCWTRAQHRDVARAADANTHEMDSAGRGGVAPARDARWAHARRCAKTAVEWDRLALAAAAGYTVALCRMFPTGASPKNDVLVGIPPGAELPAGHVYSRGAPHKAASQGDGSNAPPQPVWLQHATSLSAAAGVSGGGLNPPEPV